MINFTRKPHYDYADLLEIIRLLRSEDGCPWDKAQTHKSIRRGLLEEAYEAAEAIDNDDPVLLKEELGDVLMQVVFHADIESDAGRFTMDDVCDGVVKKLLFRHPESDPPHNNPFRFHDLCDKRFLDSNHRHNDLPPPVRVHSWSRCHNQRHARPSPAKQDRMHDKRRDRFPMPHHPDARDIDAHKQPHPPAVEFLLQLYK